MGCWKFHHRPRENENLRRKPHNFEVRTKHLSLIWNIWMRMKCESPLGKTLSPVHNLRPESTTNFCPVWLQFPSDQGWVGLVSSWSSCVILLIPSLSHTLVSARSLTARAHHSDLQSGARCKQEWRNPSSASDLLQLAPLSISSMMITRLALNHFLPGYLDWNQRWEKSSWALEGILGVLRSFSPNWVNMLNID